MKDISDAADLVATARDALLNDLLPRLPKDQRYTGLMIANAMAIALREQRSSADAMRDESVRLHKLLASTDSRRHEPGGGDAGELGALRRQLCAAIRAGKFDGGSRSPALVASLARTAGDWLAISNPKALRTNPAAG